MSISSPTGDSTAGSTGRDRVAENIRQWCAAVSIPEVCYPLLDDAALLIAIGRLREDLRTRLVRRLEQGEYPPVIPQGIVGLQIDTAEFNELNRRLGPKPGMLYWKAKTRRDALQERLRGSRFRFADDPSWNPRGFRGKSKALAAGTFIYEQERLELFDEITRSGLIRMQGARPYRQDPTPGKPGGVATDWTATAVRLTQQASQWITQVSVGSAGPRSAGAATAADRSQGQGPSPSPWQQSRTAAEVGGPALHFHDAYEILNYLAGNYYQNVRLSRVWHSHYFDALRGQVSLERELVNITVDIAELRSVVRQLDRPADGMGFSAQETARRKRILRSVWDELIERVAALARISDLVSRTEVLLNQEQGIRAEADLDRRIDDLVGRAGDREIGAENLHRMGDHLIQVEALIDAQQWALKQDIGILQRRSEL